MIIRQISQFPRRAAPGCFERRMTVRNSRTGSNRAVRSFSQSESIRESVSDVSQLCPAVAIEHAVTGQRSIVEVDGWSRWPPIRGVASSRVLLRRSRRTVSHDVPRLRIRIRRAEKDRQMRLSGDSLRRIKSWDIKVELSVQVALLKLWQAHQAPSKAHKVRPGSRWIKLVKVPRWQHSMS